MAATTSKLVILILLMGTLPAQDSLVGTWEGDTGGQHVVLVFQQDGSLSFQGQPGTWVLRMQQLVIAIGGGSAIGYDVELAGNSLTLSGGDLAGPLSLARSGESSTSTEAGTSPIAIHTFAANPSLKVGYPRGWTVTESPIGVSTVEKEGQGSAGMLILVLPLTEEIATSGALAKTMAGMVRQLGYPDLEVTGQAPHPRGRDVLTQDATLTEGGRPYLAHMWTLANPEGSLGLFAAFFAPEERYGTFKVDHLLISCLAPLIGLDRSVATTSTGSTTTDGKVEVARGVKSILFLRDTPEERQLCSLDPATGEIRMLEPSKEAALAGPTLTRDGRHAIMGCGGTKFILVDLVEKQYGTIGPGDGEVTDATISRDGKLLAMRMCTTKHVGNVDTYDYSGLYQDRFVGVLTWYTVLSVDLTTGKPVATYYADGELPDIMKDIRALGPVFSPTADHLIYADQDQVYVCEARTGKRLHEYVLPEKILEVSGLACTPDGIHVAHFSSTHTGTFTEGNTVYTISLVDLRTGQGRVIPLPPTLRPQSNAKGDLRSIMCLDFSPDGRHVVFSASEKSGEEPWYIAEFNELAQTRKPCNLYLLDCQTGACRQLTTDGQSFDPVWSGR